MTHEEVAKKVGRSRVAVSNLLRLLALEEAVKQHLHTGQLAMGHGRALLPLPTEQQAIVAQDIIKKQLSVRQTEQLINNLQNINKDEKNKRISIGLYDELVETLEDIMIKKTRLVAGVKISQLKGKYHLTMQFNNLDELKQGLDDLLG